MAQKPSHTSMIDVAVTPRIVIFYALQALESGSGSHLENWRREMKRRLPATLTTRLASVVPSPLMWPLLADAFRDEPAHVTFAEMMSALRSMDTAAACVMRTGCASSWKCITGPKATRASHTSRYTTI